MPGRQTNPNFPIRLGFVPLIDCAPVAVAMEMGIFQQHGVQVALSRELGWASVRDKLFYDSLDAAESIAGVAFALGLGFSDLRCEVAVPLILNLHGNAITLTTELGPAEIGTGEGLKNHLKKHWKKDRPLTLAATHRFSSHHILLAQWLKRFGLSSPADVEVIFLPPQFMPRPRGSTHRRLQTLKWSRKTEPAFVDTLAVLRGANYPEIQTGETKEKTPNRRVQSPCRRRGVQGREDYPTDRPRERHRPFPGQHLEEGP